MTLKPSHLFLGRPGRDSHCPPSARSGRRTPSRASRSKIVCPFAPGGGSDFIARVASNVLSQRLGQPVVVDNRPGAGGTLGTEYALHTPATATRCCS